MTTAEQTIKLDDPRHAAAKKALNAMHDFFKLSPMCGAVQWIQDSDGRVIIFTRGEYRSDLLSVVPGLGSQSVEFFELEGEP